MIEEPSKSSNARTSEPQAPIPFSVFLETVHPSVTKSVTDLWKTKRPVVGPPTPRPVMCTPALRLHCEKCDGERTFRTDDVPVLNGERAILVSYRCSDCRRHSFPC
jgi:hypothetical protein